MNTLQKTTLALIGLGAMTLAGLTFADDSATTPPPPPPPSGTPPMVTGSGEAHRGGGQGQGEFWNRFIKTDLSDTDKAALEALVKAHRDEMKTFLDANKGKMGDSTVMEQYVTLQKNFLNSLLPYVASDKLDAYNQFLANMKPGQEPKGREWEKTGSGQMNKPERKDDEHRNSGSGSVSGGKNKQKPGAQGQGMALPASVTQALDNRLASFPDTASKLAWLNGVNTKIDALAAKVTAQKSKDLLNALKNLINSKIDELNGNTVDSTAITNLLQ